MRPEARPIKFTNGHGHYYVKNKVDKFLEFFSSMALYAIIKEEWE